MIPKDKKIAKHFRPNTRFYTHAAVLTVFLNVVADGSSWQHRLAEFVNKSPHIPKESMGFFHGLDEDPFGGKT